MSNTPDIYNAEGIWSISDVLSYKQNNQWPTPTDSGNLDCYTIDNSRSECGCVSVSLNGVVATGTLTDPSGTTPGTEYSLPKSAFVVTTNGYSWYNWWWENNYFWNWHWRYPWYSSWWGYYWYWGYSCYLYSWYMSPVNLYNITCENSDKYPTCGTGNTVSNFSWGGSFAGNFGISYTPSNSGIIPSVSSNTYTYESVTPGVTPSTTTVSTDVIANESGVIPWNTTWSRFYNRYVINRGMALAFQYTTTTYDVVANTGNTGNTNGIDIVFYSGRYDYADGGYNDYYYGSLRADDPTWSSIQWKSGYPAALTGVGKFWFALTTKTTTVNSGLQQGWLYDSNGSGYPVPGNYGSYTTVNQTTRFYRYNGCGSITDVTDEAVSGTPFAIGLYSPNQKTVNPLGYWYSHKKANVCDASYDYLNNNAAFNLINGAYTQINCDSFLSFNREAYIYYYPDDAFNVYNCQACSDASYSDPDNPEHPCLAVCAPGQGGEPLGMGNAQTCSDALVSLYDEASLYGAQRPSCSTSVFSPTSLQEIEVIYNNYQYTIPCTTLQDYDNSLYYGYHFGTSSYRPGLQHPKIAWAIGEYTKNQFNCTGLIAVSGLSFTNFEANALESVTATSTYNNYYYPYGLFGSPHGCRSSVCLNNEGKITISYLMEDFLAFNDDCSASNNGYEFSTTFCGPCSTAKTIVDASGISNFTPSGLVRYGSSISYEQHCYIYANNNTYRNKTVNLHYEPVSGIIPIINGVAYDTDPYYTSGNFIVNLTGLYISPTSNSNMVRDFITNKVVFGLRSSGTGVNSVFNYRCADVQLYWPYCSGSSIPVKIVPKC